MPVPASRPSLSPLIALFAHRQQRRAHSDASDHQRPPVTSSGSASPGPSKSSLTVPCPLSPIAASPVCPPTVCASPEPFSLNSDEEHAELDELEAPTTPDKRAAPRLHDSRRCCTPPTWISIPPTPPPTLVRRSVTCHTRRPTRVSPSTTFPTVPPFHPQSPNHALRRRASIAVMSPIPRPPLTDDDDDPFTVMFPRWRRDNTTRPSSPLRSMILSPCDDVDASPPKRSRPLFQISGDTDTEDSHPPLESPIEDTRVAAAAGRHNEKHKDDTRRFHALLELLTTEIGYLMDLRALVEVYMHQLPSLTCRPIGRSHSSFSAISRVGSFTHLGQATQNVASSTTHPNSDRPAPRPVFAENDIQLLTRNAEEILELHERFVAELRLALEPFGLVAALSLARDAEHQYADAELVASLAIQIDEAVKVVCTKFATESSRFNSYQTFCASHPEALDLLRKTQQQYPLEWHGFEHQCSALIRDSVEEGQTELPTNPESPSEGLAVLMQAAVAMAPTNRTRTTSLTSFDGAVRTLRSKTGLRSKESVAFPSDADGRKEASRPRRLALMDYMIKPVQRICKYPLLLDQLKPGKLLDTNTSGNAPSMITPARKPDVQVIVESAAQAMRHVASSVDDARHQQDIAIQTALIAARICLSPGVADAPPLATGHACQALTPSFLASLGSCLLAGALDVVHYQTSKPIGNRGKVRTKYLGAFLYAGGYFILAKIGKGKVYEPRHWLSLADFDVIDLCEEEAILPCSFRFLANEHQFELSASCKREKEVWLAAIRATLNQTPSWANEPVSSIHCDGKGEIVPSTLDGGPFEAINALPTIQSIPELANDPADVDIDPQPTSALSSNAVASPASASEPPSRRSSATSGRSIFSPLASDSGHLVISRSTSAARANVDAGLQDVISQACVHARSRASPSEEDLFSAPTITRRSSGILTPESVCSAGAGVGTGSPFASGFSGRSSRERALRSEGARVFRRRSFLDGSDTFTKRTKSFTGRRQAKKLSVVSMVELGSSQNRATCVSEAPPTMSQRGRSSGGTTDSAPSTKSTSEPQTPPLLPDEPDTRATGKGHHRGLVHNVMDFFSSHPSSPSTTPTSDPEPLPPLPTLPPSVAPDHEPRPFRTITPAILKRWAQGHRRPRSSSDAAATDAATAMNVVSLSQTQRQPSSEPETEPASALVQSEPFMMDEAEICNFELGLAAKSAVVQLSVSPRSFPPPDPPPAVVRAHKKISLMQRIKSIEVG